jgi:hypothetical protein
VSIFGHKKPVEASIVTQMRVTRAERDLSEQQDKHAHAATVLARQREALRRNHLAELMFEALSAKRSE